MVFAKGAILVLLNSSCKRGDVGEVPGGGRQWRPRSVGGVGKGRKVVGSGEKLERRDRTIGKKKMRTKR